MNELKINNTVRLSNIIDFCGQDNVKAWTGDTRVKTSNGYERIEGGDTIIKNEDGSLTLKKI